MDSVNKKTLGYFTAPMVNPAMNRERGMNRMVGGTR
jgi:hypothetical protein